MVCSTGQLGVPVTVVIRGGRILLDEDFLARAIQTQIQMGTTMHSRTPAVTPPPIATGCMDALYKYMHGKLLLNGSTVEFT